MASGISIELSQKVPEASSPVFKIKFKDDAGEFITPNSDTITWTLTDDKGTLINERQRVPVESAEEVVIVLEPDDLLASQRENRILLIEYEYDSTFGDDLHGKFQAAFKIAPMKGLVAASAS